MRDDPRMQYWLFSIDSVEGDWTVGTTGPFWNYPRTDPHTGEMILRKSDGLGAGEPRWARDDAVLGFNPASGRFFAILRVVIPSYWNAADETWGFDLEIVAFSDRGPTPKEVGITITQGARKRISGESFEKARRVIVQPQSTTGV